MKYHKVAYRYATALLKVGIEQKCLEEIKSEVDGLLEILNTSTDFSALCSSPTIDVASKQKVYATIISKEKKQKDSLFNQFVNLLLAQRRGEFIKDILLSFNVLYNDHIDVTNVTLTFATEPTKTLLSTIESKLKKELKIKKIQINTLVDEAIIGGYLLEFDNKIIDNTVASSLQRLSRTILSQSLTTTIHND